MRAYVIGSSALYFWRHSAHASQALKDVVSSPLADCPSSAEDLRTIVIRPSQFGAAPIHLMVPNAAMRYSRNTYNYTVESGKIPENAFRKVGEQICVASPEFCLVQAAEVLSIPQVIELGMELCGTYALSKESDRGFIARDHQLMTVKSLRDFMSKYNKVRLNRKLFPWLRFIAEESHSPMETREHLLMSLPKRLGGHGLPRASLNMRIDLTRSEQVLAARSFSLCDMCWPAKKVVVEYDGQEDHASPQDRASDATRQNILVNKGYDIFVITGRQIYNADEFDSIVKNIARRLGFRLKNYPGDWTVRRDGLRKELFKSVGGHSVAQRRQGTLNDACMMQPEV